MTRIRLVALALFVSAGCLPLTGCGGSEPEVNTVKDLRNRGGAVPTKDGKPPKPQ